jgi:hypothetical protein
MVAVVLNGLIVVEVVLVEMIMVFVEMVEAGGV